MLALRPNCEHCDRDLPPDDRAARICTYECTFCATCTDELLRGVCPNCGGELVPRPIRPAALLDASAPVAERIHQPVDLDAHRAALAARDDSSDHAGVVLARYAAAWRAGDLDGVLACYAPDFTLHYGGASRFAGSHVGRDAALAVLAEVSTVAPRELRSIDEVLVGDEAGALVVTERLDRDGETAEVQRTLRYRVADGLLAECWLLESDQAAVDHFWR